MNRKEKLILLSDFINLETGQVAEDNFDYENTLYERSLKMKALSVAIRGCMACPGLNIPNYTAACPGWGNLCSSIVIVGQSLHLPGMKSDLPFTGGSGYLIDAALRASDLRRQDVFLTNCVHCHPENNRETTEKEKQNCLKWLKKELEIVSPRLIVALGNDAQWAVQNLLREKPSFSFSSPSEYRSVSLKHPASILRSAPPEDKINWIIRLSNEFDKYKEG